MRSCITMLNPAVTILLLSFVFLALDQEQEGACHAAHWVTEQRENKRWGAGWGLLLQLTAIRKVRCENKKSHLVKKNKQQPLTQKTLNTIMVNGFPKWEHGVQRVLMKNWLESVFYNGCPSVLSSLHRQSASGCDRYCTSCVSVTEF